MLDEMRLSVCLRPPVLEMTYQYDDKMTREGGAAVPIIKPISDLRNRSGEISDLVHRSEEPVFITRNGVGDMVVMSLSQYDRLQLKLSLFKKLAVAECQRGRRDRGRRLHQVMKDLRKRIHVSA